MVGGINLYTSITTMEAKNIIRTGALLSAAAVMLGAFGAHGLESAAEEGKIPFTDLDTWETATKYLFYHSLGMLIIGLLWERLHPKRATWSVTAMIAGTGIFCGSLFLLVVSEPIFGSRLSWLGAITPIGGLSLIASWILLFLAASKQK